jgi:hypothetical protein
MGGSLDESVEAQKKIEGWESMLRK